MGVDAASRSRAKAGGRTTLSKAAEQVGRLTDERKLFRGGRASQISTGFGARIGVGRLVQMRPDFFENYTQRTVTMKLSAEAQNWLSYLSVRFDLEPHEAMLAQQAAQTWDEIVAAKKLVAKHGLVVHTDRGGLKSNPAVAVLKDARLLFARLVKQLDVGVALPPIPGARQHRKKAQCLD